MGVLTSSCKKDEETNSGNVVAGDNAKIQALVDKYKAMHVNDAQHRPNAWQVMGADFGGAMGGGEIGSMFGPAGTFYGALIGGVGGSLYSLLRTNGNATCDTCFVPMLTDTWDASGIWHNQFCDSILSQRGLYYMNDTIAFTALTNKLKQLYVNKHNAVYSGNLTVDSIAITVNDMKNIDENWDDYIETDEPNRVVTV